MLTILFKKIVVVTILSLTALLPDELSAQFIRLTINLPPSFEAKVDPVPPMVIEPPIEMAGSNQIGMKKVGTRWIEFRTRENAFLVISAKFDNLPGAGLPQLYFLNNGTSEFAKASLLTYRRNQVSMLDKPYTMKDLPEETLYLSAWLGVPSDRGGLLTIEFH